jgi:hypothetical protein
MISDNLPPHDIEAEKAVLGSMLIDSEGIFKIATFLAPEDFFNLENQLVYEACFNLYQRNEGKVGRGWRSCLSEPPGFYGTHLSPHRVLRTDSIQTGYNEAAYKRWQSNYGSWL